MAAAYPQLDATLADTSQPSRFAIWIDTVTNANVATPYLSGVEGLVNGDNTPEQVMESVRKAAAAAREKL